MKPNAEKSYKAVILIGGPQKGTRFRPLSLDCPKPLFPIAGIALLLLDEELNAIFQFQIPGLKEILFIGFYQPNDHWATFISDIQGQYSTVNIRYLQEFAPLGTAGGIYHFRDQILLGGTDACFVLNADVCGDLPLMEMVDQLNILIDKQSVAESIFLMLTTEAAREQSLNFGCAAIDDSSEIIHYVEKPTTFLSKWINCGVYLMQMGILDTLADVFKNKTLISNSNNGFTSEALEAMNFEKDVFPKIAGHSMLFALKTTRWWSQLKTASAAIYANRHYLNLYHTTHPERLTRKGEPTILGDVYIHPSVEVHPSCVIGPNVSIGKNVKIGIGVRIKESIILDGATLQDHCCVMFSVVGWNTHVGLWCRIEGTAEGPNPNMPFAKLECKPLFLPNGRLNPSISVIGCNVSISDETMIMNSIVLPHKELASNYKNQIIL
ncbi:Mannose-1-phosphate guanyltransferase alpha-B [Trichinella pseudospiralis]|uniref:Mannose-1-phosphate guanyltransferase alpha-B n=1 Tax=Trichinella pseudospiralis TaxID=6337 RepID=A0A0V0Y927_TRIPS|nr:Mannose-1-phosphate guanyltransferase alpha-B [Trichinella pseudospiralis]KRY70694.1 Mannose-1-phosphate guanyltransferase alpha-B [Trichinella pseudospiralis]KRZ30266.1 Mannose-1-phosphate guanyltransferase alpha-B [Trichinella pseudospiralis]KRZ38302.1 Mannose-1-phosphate guanyltransferase alpha-B [Trichinella pseudospiralis]